MKMKMNLLKRIMLHFRVPLRKLIIFESNPPMTGNVMPVYNEMIKRRVNEKYKLVWLVDDKEKFKQITVKNTEVLEYNPRNKKEIKKKKSYLRFAKAIVFENRIFGKTWRNQFVINLMHGMPIKALGDYQQNKPCDYLVISTEALSKVVSREMHFPQDRIIALGYPRADILQKRNGSLKKLINSDSLKTILWMPTFRNHSSGKLSDGKVYEFGVPLFECKQDFYELNNVLKQNNCALIIKLHPAEDVSKYVTDDLENIHFLSDCEIQKNGATLYGLIADADALITDYSSVYYDFLLTERPIGLVLDDLDEYGSSRGFAIQDYYNVVKGNYIYCKNDLQNFIMNVAAGYDPNQAEMKKAKLKYAEICDFKSTERVTDFILDHIRFSSRS